MDNIWKILNKDSWAFGVFVSLVSPFLLLLVLQSFFYLLTHLLNIVSFESDRLYLMSLSANLLLMRYYLVSAKQVKTGKSILLATFILIILFFITKPHQDLSLKQVQLLVQVLALHVILCKVVFKLTYLKESEKEVLDLV